MSDRKLSKAQKRAAKEGINKFLSILLTFAMVLQTSPVAYARMDEFGAEDYVAPLEATDEAVPEEDATQEEEYVEQTVPEEEPVVDDDVADPEVDPVDDSDPVADEQPEVVQASIYVSSLNATVSIGEDTIADTSGNVMLTEGEDVEFYVTPNDEYELVDESVKVTVDGVESVLTGYGSYTLPGSMVKEGTEISVEAFTRTYIYEDDYMKVTAVLEEADAIPNNTVLQVVSVNEDSYKDDVYTYNYDAYMEALNRSVGAPADKPEYTADNTLLYDVAFLTVDQDTGETIEVEPAKGETLVTFEFKDQQLDGYLRAEQAADVTVAHMPVVDDAKAATTYATTNITADDVVVQYVADEDFGASGTDTIEVKTQSFTVFALANVKKAEEGKVTEYIGQNKDVRVVATVSDPSAIPDEAQLVVRTVRPESNNYDYDAYMQALNDGSDNPIEYKPTNTLLFDVAFIMTDENGNEYEVQPAEGATVNVDFQLLNDQIAKDLDAPSASDVEVTHLPLVDEAKGATTNQSGALNPNDIVVEKVDSAATGDESIAITATSFSVYALSYTVDFTLDGLTYSIAGESEVLLSTIFEKLGIEDNVAKAESVVFTNEDLVSVKQLKDGSDWKLTSKAPFTSEEKLTVTMASGKVIEIVVTDAQNALTVNTSLYDYDDSTVLSFPSDFGGSENILLFAWVSNGSSQITSALPDNTPWACINLNSLKGSSSPYTVNISKFNSSSWGGGTVQYSGLNDEQKSSLMVRIVHTSENELSLGSLKNMAQYQPSQYGDIWNSSFDGYGLSRNHNSGLGENGNYEVGFIKGNTNLHEVALQFDPKSDMGQIPSGKSYILLDATSADGNSHYYYVVDAGTSGATTVDTEDGVQYHQIDGQWSGRQNFSENWQDIKATVITPKPGKTIQTGGVNPNSADYTEGYVIGDYTYTYEGYFDSVDEENHIHRAGYVFKLKTPTYESAKKPADTLGTEGVEFGVIADEYEQYGHTETNFAVKTLDTRDGGNIDIDGSGDTPMPFYAGNIEGNQLWLSDKTKCPIDLFVTQNDIDADRVKITADRVTVIPTEQNTINSYVQSLINTGTQSSQSLASKSTMKPTNYNTNNKVIDTTQFPDNTTIYVDCTNVDLSMTGWELHKKQGQTVVFNVPGSHPTISKYYVTTYDDAGNVIVNNLDTNTAALDGDPAHNKLIDEVVLEHVVFNAYEADELTITSGPSGLFLAPSADRVNQDSGSGAGWVLTGGKFESHGEWHFYRHERHYKAEGGFALKARKAIKSQDGAGLDYVDQAYEFGVYPANENGDYIKWVEQGGSYVPVVVPQSEAEAVETGTASSSGSVDFLTHNFTNNDFPDGVTEITGYYNVVEIIPDDAKAAYNGGEITYAQAKADDSIDLNTLTFAKDGVQYDAEPKLVAITAKHIKESETHGRIEITAKVDGENAGVTTEDNKTYYVELGEFVNHKGTEATIKVNKEVTGIAWAKGTKDENGYKFMLWSGSGTPMPEGTETITSGGAERTVKYAYATSAEMPADFGKICYSEAGTYIYYIAEVNPGDNAVNGMTYDTAARRVEVVVATGSDGNLEATVNYFTDQNGNESSTDIPTITNTYKTKALIKATKDFEDWGKAESFEFNLEPGDSTLTGDDGTAIKSPMPAGATDNKVVKTVTKDDITALFGEITFDTPGDYEYMITETKGTADGVTYDTAVHKVVIKVAQAAVEDDIARKLVATVNYYDTDGETVLTTVTYHDGAGVEHKDEDVQNTGAIITNTYEGVEEDIEVTKNYTGDTEWGKAKKFTFDLAVVEPANAPRPKVKNDDDVDVENMVAEATKDKTTASFGTIKFEKAGVYRYKITERNDGVDGVSYDTSKYYAQITVSKDADNKLTAEVKYYKDGAEAQKAEFTNKYESTSAELEATKEFNDWGKATSFDFKLTAGDSSLTDEDGNAIKSPMPAGADASGTLTRQATNTNGKKAVFGEITYEKAGTYSYTIEEIPPTPKVDGITYDDTPYAVVVTVTKANDATNKLTATVKYGNVSNLIIPNTYAEITAELKATKNFNDWGKADKFTFNLMPGTNEEGTPESPMPAGTADGKKSIDVTQASPMAEFGSMTFKKPGTYNYIINETKGEADGVTYDDNRYKASVVVGQDADGNLTATVKYYDANDVEVAAATASQFGEVITNTYEATKANIEATKNYQGDADWGKAESFTFRLTPGTATYDDGSASGTSPMPVTAEDGKVEKQATKSATTVNFGDITFEKAGTYNYKVKEVVPSPKVKGITYDEVEHTVTVTVTKDPETNKLTATVKYYDADGETELNDGQTITNNYDETTAELKATKTMKDWGTATSFQFNLEPGDSSLKDIDNNTIKSPMPEGSLGAVMLSKTVTKAVPTAQFGAITFYEVGTYNYTIYETIPADKDKVPGVVYDTTQYTATVTVTKNADTGKLEASVVYKKGDTEVTDVTFYDDNGEEQSGAVTEYGVVFKNDYATTKNHLEVVKNYVGDTDWAKAESFTFTATPVGGAPMPKDNNGNGLTSITAVATKQTDKTAVFDDIEFITTGTYQYKIVEQNDHVDGVTYDTNAYYGVITVTTDADNKLTSSVKYLKADGTELAAPLSITNTYEATKAEIQVNKSFNAWGSKVFEFDFTLTAGTSTTKSATGEDVTGTSPMPAGSTGDTKTATASYRNMLAKFGEITYEQAGTYEYKLQEVVPDDDHKVKGVSYDGTEYTVVVEVTADPDTNELSAEVLYGPEYDEETHSYTGGALSLTVTNKYDDASTNIQVTKGFDNWGKADKFDFVLAAAGDAPMPSGATDGKLTKSATKNASLADFGSILYTTAGDYEYTITEINDGVDGVTYDTTPHTVVVHVAKDDTGKLVATPIYDATYDGETHSYTGDSSLTITNTYAGAKAHFEATKSFNDWGKANDFTFTLEAGANDAGVATPMPATAVKTVTKDDPDTDINEAIAVWDEVEFGKAGTYHYTITERDDGIDGVTYDTTPHEVVVKVTKADDATNKLIAKVTYDEADSLTITNRYAGVEVDIEATKDFNDWGKADSFTFTLAPADNGEGNPASPMPGNAAKIEKTVTKDNPETADVDETVAVWSGFEFEKAGTYNYTITETDDGVPGVTYDTTPHEVVVTVAKGADNKLTATVKYDGKDSLTITNTFEDTKVHFEATKVYNGDAEWGKATSFTFTLASVDGAPMPTEKTEVTITKDTPDLKAVFGDITFDTVGTYNYTITEKDDGVPGVTYDTTPHKVKVEVTKADNNALVATVTYDEAESLTITNTFSDVKKSIDVTKNYEGDTDWGKATSFNFNLVAKSAKDAEGNDIAIDDIPMPPATSAVATKTNNPATFGEITYDKPGTYVYGITEVNDHVDGVTYDTTEHTATVTVTKDADNKLTAEVVYDQPSEDGESLLVTNTYEATEAQIEVTKIYGVNDSKWGAENKFTFKLTPGPSHLQGETGTFKNSPMPLDDEGNEMAEATATATTTAKTAVFDTISYDKAGTYVYFVEEIAGDKPYVKYDTSKHTVIVLVSKDADTNKLTASVMYDDDAETLEVTNEYDAEGKLTLTGVAKKLENREMTEKDVFTFELKDEEGTVLATGTNDADGTITFTPDTITYKLADLDVDENGVDKETTFNYTITEVVPSGATQNEDGTWTKDGVTFDANEYPVEIKVKDSENHDGTLVVTPSKLDDLDPKVVLKNGYDTEGEITFSGTKELTGRKLKAGEFMFDLYDADGALKETVSNAADGSYSFTTIKYTGADLDKDADGNFVETTKTYKVVERSGNDSSITYDDTEYEITVTLTDNGKGEIECVADPAENIYDFKNEYNAEGETTLEGNKSIDGRSFKENDEATFKIVATGEFKDVAPMPAEDTVTIKPTTGTSENFQFATIKYTLDDLKNDDGTYDKVRVFTYEVTEDAFSMQGVGEKDSTTYTVNVTVRDNGTGNLIVTTSDNAKALNFKNKYEAEGSITLDATKAMSGRDFKEGDEYTFTVTADKDDAPMPAETSVTITPTSGNKAEFSFGDINYTLADAGKTYTYTVTETGKVDGVTIDTAKTVTVSIADKGDGTLEIKQGDEVIEKAVVDFTNKFASVKKGFEATKQFNDWGKAESFTFKLEAVTEGAPMPDKAEAIATKDDIVANFDEVEFEQAGIYEYTITEVDDGVDGVTYDTDPHKVVVTVTADPDTNELSATVKYDDADALIITNTYDSTKATIQATKAFEDWGKADSFEFTLAPVGDAPMPDEAVDGKVVKEATKDAPTVVFGEIDYKAAGEYKYTITETKGDADGVTYDTTPHEVIVTVAKGDNNKLSTSVKYDGKDALIITNTYEATKATIEATKEFNDWGKADHFDFVLDAVTKDAPMPANTTATATEANKTAAFDEITYEQCGTYEYTVTEVNGGADGVTYDTTPHKVTVKVTKDTDNKMSAEVIYADGDSLIITNTYTATEAPIEATKNFSSWGKAESFTFDLAPVSENAPMPLDSKGNAVTTATATKDAIKASFGTVKYEKAGTYEYTITERNDHVDGVTYDTTPHTVKVEVTKDVDSNELTAKVIYDGDKTALNITNTYEGVKKGFEVTKQFNDWGKAKSFTFDLAAVTKDAPMPEVTEATATEANPTAVFDEVEFGKAGIYEYTITERNDGADGVTYDTTPHAVTVIVSKDADSNTLSAEVKYDGKASLIVTNTYAATKATIEATKEFNDWGKAKTFTFDLAAIDGAPMPDNTTAVATDANNTATFDEITYEKVGTYEYTVTERNDGADGVTYDTTPHKVTVTVTKDDTTNALSATVDYDGAKSLIVTNTYEATQATIEATKQFDAWGMADEFKFDLAAVTEGAPMPASTVATATEANPTATFETITFEKAGTYEYTVTERDGKADGVTYDLTAYPVTVTVTKDADTNKLSAEVSYGGEKQLIITNTYAATEAQFSVTKDFEDWGKADEFKFDLAAVTEGAPMPAETTVTATKANKTASFEKLTFEKAGTYEYTITEQNGGADGVTYDTTAHAVTVIVSKANDNTNALSAEVRYDGENVDSLIVTNTYEAAKATIKATKQFNDWGKAESFTFTLTPSDGSPMPVDADGNVVKTAVATKDAVDAIFGEITYEAAGTYTYSIAEVNDHVDGVTYDTSAHRVVVEVTKADDATNKLTAKVTYDGADALIITNTYASTKAIIQATKAFEDWGKADSFEFTLASVDGAPMPDEAGTSTTLAKTVTKAEPTAVFGEIDYKKAGTYEYTITETKGDADGVTYDTAEHKVTVTVAKDADTNELVATVDYDGAKSLIITNTYAGTETTLEATKKFDDWGKADSFTFQIAAVDGAPMPEKATAVATEDEPTASFGTVKFEKTGTYEYTITELNGGADGVTYDTTPHAVKVTVTKDADNKMSASVKYDGKDSLIVTNTYAATEATIEAEKQFNNWGKAESFTFDLAAVTEGAPMPEVTEAKATEEKPIASFGDITYEKAGTYEYTVTEVNDHVDGVTYDTTPHKVTVVVSKDAETNELTAEVEYGENDKLVITNTFTAAEATIEAEKEFNDWGKAESFTFNLAAVTEGAPMPESTTAKATEAKPIASFGDISYDKAGTYEYTVTEVNDHVDGVTYDTTPHKVTVIVSKDAETNELTAEVEYGENDMLVITNAFKAAEATIEATKSINVWGEESEFTFELAAEGDAPMPASAKEGKATAVATKDAPTAAFGAISYDKAGEYKYTVTEVAGKAKYVTYDTEKHPVTVTVTKDAETNALTAKVTYGDAESLTITNTYSATGKLELSGKKAITNKPEDMDLSGFKFTVKEGDKTVATGESAADGTIKYTAIDYTLADVGDHIYKVSEDASATKPGVTNTTETVTVKVSVTDNGDGTLKVEKAAGSDVEINVVNFTNSYTTTKGELKVKKNLVGRAWKDGDTFEFTATPVGDAPKLSKTKVTITNATTGAVESFGEIEFTKPGSYTYTVKETKGTISGLTYDTAEHRITFKVVADAKGNLVAAEGSSLIQTAEVTNTYKEETKKTNTSTKTNLAKTGDTFDPSLAAGMAVFGLLIVAFGLRKRREYE